VFDGNCRNEGTNDSNGPHIFKGVVAMFVDLLDGLVGDSRSAIVFQRHGRTRVCMAVEHPEHFLIITPVSKISLLNIGVLVICLCVDPLMRPTSMFECIFGRPEPANAAEVGRLGSDPGNTESLLTGRSVGRADCGIPATGREGGMARHERRGACMYPHTIYVYAGHDDDGLDRSVGHPLLEEHEQP
jgi:hypothetical protein